MQRHDSAAAPSPAGGSLLVSASVRMKQTARWVAGPGLGLRTRARGRGEAPTAATLMGVRGVQPDL